MSKKSRKRDKRDERRAASQTKATPWSRPKANTTSPERVEPRRNAPAKATSFIEGLFTSRPLPDYARPKRVELRDTMPEQHVTKFTPSTVIKQKDRKQEQSSKKFQPVEKPSSLTRDKIKNCKTRPSGVNKRRAGGSAAKKFIPWCG